MFCLETAIKLLAFSWVVYEEKCASTANRSVGVCSHSRKNGKRKMDIQKKEIQLLEEVRTAILEGDLTESLGLAYMCNKKQQDSTFRSPCMQQFFGNEATLFCENLCRFLHC